MNDQTTVDQWIDVHKIEQVICMESFQDSCYQALAGMIHNQAIRNECRFFEDRARDHQEELRRIYPLSQESENAIEVKLYHYLKQLEPPYLFLNAIFNMLINHTGNKIDIYRYLAHKNRENRQLFERYVKESKEEMSFLCKERNYHISSFNMTQLK